MIVPTVPKWVQKIVEWVALLAVFGTAGSLWINTEVERRMGELAVSPADHPKVVENSTKLESLGDGQVRIERKVDAFSEKFLEYLERQANGRE